MASMENALIILESNCENNCVESTSARILASPRYTAASLRRNQVAVTLLALPNRVLRRQPIGDVSRDHGK